MNQYNQELIKIYKEACGEKNLFIRKLKLAFCVVMAEDKKLLEELAKR